MPGLSSDAAEELLRGLPAFKILGLLHGASNYTFLAQLGPHRPAVVRAVYKPAKGESPLWDFDAGTLYKREVAAYELSKVLGWPRIPPTVVRRKAPHGVGAVQLFIEADGRHFLGANNAPAETWIQVALFDVITNNADRKSGHCLLDGDDRLFVVDHGVCFNEQPKLRTVIWDFSGEEIPGGLREDLRALLPDLDGDLGGRLSELLDPDEVGATRSRLASLIEAGRFPEPGPERPYPWPPV